MGALAGTIPTMQSVRGNMTRERRRELDAASAQRRVVDELSEHLSPMGSDSLGRDEAAVLGRLIAAWRDAPDTGLVSGEELARACGWARMRPEAYGRALASVLMNLRRFFASSKFGAAAGVGQAWIECVPAQGWRLRTGKKSLAVRAERAEDGE